MSITSNVIRLKLLDNLPLNLLDERIRTLMLKAEKVSKDPLKKLLAAYKLLKFGNVKMHDGKVFD